MKLLTIALLMASSQTFAQALELGDLESLMTEKQTVLESVNVGMTKNVVTKGSITANGSVCKYMLTQLQSILKIDDDKMIILSRETFRPAATDACRLAKQVVAKETVLFDLATPKVTAEVAALDEMDINSISQNGDLISVNFNDKIDDDTTAEVTLQYDLSKSLFRNQISSTGSDYTITTSDAASIDVSTVDLTDVQYCEDSDSRDNCERGNYSDILF